MKYLVVVAHPLKDSLCATIAQEIVAHLNAENHSVVVKDLYQEAFNPVLSETERQSYYAPSFDSSALTTEIKQLQEAEALLLVFPTWWFGFPAILKGWFDRVWAPGYAYNHAKDLGAITPCLTNLKEVTAITTLGSPWWVDNLVLWRPIYRVLKIAILGACTKNCRLKMLSLYKSESVAKVRVEKFIEKVKGSI